MPKKREAPIYRLTLELPEDVARALKAQGFNVGANIGKAAGAGIEDHIHLHVVPRWMADTNFWPVLSATKGIPQHLDSTYLVLKKTWEAL